jgi:predicted transcriptional regulator
MVTAGMSSSTANARDDESDEERTRRIAREAEGLARAIASADAGQLISSEAVDAWIDSLGTDHELPLPRPGG